MLQPSSPYENRPRPDHPRRRTRTAHGIVIHGTRQTLVENNVIFNTPGHNVSIEDAASTDNVLRGNLALENRVLVLSQATLRGQGDNQAANFWLRAARNTLTGNVAAASMAHGFWYDEVADGPSVFLGNTAHSSYSRSVKTDFVRDAGLFVVHVGDERLEFSDSLFYQNGIGVWPSETGAMTFRNIVFADHWKGPAMAMDTGGPATIFEDNVFVGRTRAPARGELSASAALPPALFIQYSGIIDARRPLFAHYGATTLISANDIFVEWQAQFLLSDVRLLHTDPNSRNLHDLAITTLLDGSYGPAPGTYYRVEHPQLGPTGATRVNLGESGDYLRMEQRLGWAMLRTLRHASPSRRRRERLRPHSQRHFRLTGRADPGTRAGTITAARRRAAVTETTSAPPSKVTIQPPLAMN